MSISIRLPAVTADFEAGTIAVWHKAIGDSVQKGEIIIDVETDKAVVEVEASDSGVLGSILVPAGSDDVSVDTIIGVLLEDGETAQDIDDTKPAPTQKTPLTAIENLVSTSSAEKTTVEGMTSATTKNRIIASPRARRVARQNNIDLSQIHGRGPNRRILRADVEQAIEGTAPPQKTLPTDISQSAFTSIPNNNVRKVIARRLTEAKQQIPHFYLTVECELDALLDMRRQINERHREKGSAVKLSVNDCIIKATALALNDVPAANASWADDAIRRYNDVDIAVAVATENGLITPIVHRADKKSLDDISIDVKDLADRANRGRLHPDEYKGGSFTISNLGMYGVKEFSAIINPPQSCILAVGAAEKRPVVHGDSLAIATLMTCTLSVDHRSIDGAVGAAFLQAFKRSIEKPLLLVLD